MRRLVCLLCLIGLPLGAIPGTSGFPRLPSALADDAPRTRQIPLAQQIPADRTIISLRVEPATLRLTGSNRRQQLLVTGVGDDGREVVGDGLNQCMRVRGSAFKHGVLQLLQQEAVVA